MLAAALSCRIVPHCFGELLPPQGWRACQQQPLLPCHAVPAWPADVAVQLESDKVAGVRREIAEVDAQLARAERLLKIADPDG